MNKEKPGFYAGPSRDPRQTGECLSRIDNPCKPTSLADNVTEFGHSSHATEQAKRYGHPDCVFNGHSSGCAQIENDATADQCQDSESRYLGNNDE